MKEQFTKPIEQLIRRRLVNIQARKIYNGQLLERLFSPATGIVLLFKPLFIGLIISLVLSKATAKSDVDTCPTNTLYALNSTGTQLNKLDATTYAVIESYTLTVSTYSIAFNSTDGKVYYVTSAANPTNPKLYVFDPVTKLSSATSCSLPTIPSGSGTYYISAGSDASGNLYFTTSTGQAAYRINPTSSCTVTTLWTASTLIADPQMPYNETFTDLKDVVVDASGNLIFVDENSSYGVWTVDPTTRQITYRGSLTGVSGTIGDVFFKGSDLFVTTQSNGTYQVNTTTLAATSVSSYNSAEVANAPCEAGSLPALASPDPCLLNLIYTVNSKNIRSVDATTFAPVKTYTLPAGTYSIAWATNGLLYTVAGDLNPVNPPIYALNPVTGAVYKTSCTFAYRLWILH